MHKGIPRSVSQSRKGQFQKASPDFTKQNNTFNGTEFSLPEAPFLGPNAPTCLLKLSLQTRLAHLHFDPWQSEPPASSLGSAACMRGCSTLVLHFGASVSDAMHSQVHSSFEVCMFSVP